MKIKLMTVAHNNKTDEEYQACQNNATAFNELKADYPPAWKILTEENEDGIPDCVSWESFKEADITKEWNLKESELPKTYIMISDDGHFWKTHVKLSNNSTATMVKAVKTAIENNGNIPTAWLIGPETWDGTDAGNGLIGLPGLGQLCDYLPPGLKWICDIKIPPEIWLVAAGASSLAMVNTNKDNKLAKVVYGGIAVGCIFKFATIKKQ